MNKLMKFERIENYIIVVPIVLIGLIFLWLYANSNAVHNGNECEKFLGNDQINVGTADFLKAAASANRKCVQTAVAKFGDQAMPFAMASGFASVFLKDENPDLGVEVMDSLIRDGSETYFFANDPALLAALTEIHPVSTSSQKVKIETIFDFVLANSSEETRKQVKPFKMARYIAFAPAANLPSELIRPFCANENCTVTPDINVYCTLADPAWKIQFNTDPLSVNAQIARCDVTPELINLLRLNGYLDSKCSSTFQVNASMIQNKIMKCDDILPNISKYSFSDQDIIEYFRNYSFENNRYHAENLKKFSELFPDSKF